MGSFEMKARRLSKSELGSLGHHTIASGKHSAILPLNSHHPCDQRAGSPQAGLWHASLCDVAACGLACHISYLLGAFHPVSSWSSLRIATLDCPVRVPFQGRCHPETPPTPATPSGLPPSVSAVPGCLSKCTSFSPSLLHFLNSL